MKTLLVAAIAATAFGVFADEPAPVAAPAADKTAAEAAEEGGDSGFYVEAGVDVLSDYMWRGVILNDNCCWQPSVSIGYNTEDFGGIYFNYWASFDLTHKRNNCAGGGNSRRCMAIQEQDFYVGYTKSFGDFDFEIGWYWYDYPYNGPHHKAGSLSSDLYADLAWNTGYVKLGTKLLWGYYTAHEHEPATLYAVFSVSKDFNIEQVEGLTITPKALLGVGNVAFVQNNTGIRDAETAMADQTLSLSASYEVNEHFSIGAKINYTWTPSHTLRHARYMSWGEDNAHMLVWGGVFATLSF